MSFLHMTYYWKLDLHIVDVLGIAMMLLSTVNGSDLLTGEWNQSQKITTTALRAVSVRGPPGLAQNDPRQTLACIWVVHVLKLQFHEKTPREREKRTKFSTGEGKKHEMFGPPTLRAPTLPAAQHSKLPSSWLPLFLGLGLPHFLSFLIFPCFEHFCVFFCSFHFS